jgi:hypothetical protein
VAYAIAPGQVRIEWNGASLPLLEARSATLEIHDGDLTQNIPIEADQLRSTSIVYSHHSSRISIRLRVVGPDPSAAPVEEAIQFVGQPALRPPPDDRGVAAVVQREPLVVPTLSPEVPAMRADRVRPAPPRQGETPPTRRSVADRFALSGPAPKAAAPVSALPDPPALTSRPSVAALPDVLSSPPLRLKPAVPEPTTAPYNGPRSGRLIWTGVLGKRGVVDIEGNRASMGTLVGGLPGVPVSIRVSPAEFGRDGLMVYSLDAAGTHDRERPARSNGWNAVQFQVDADRARGLVVLESPNTANEFRRLVVRSDLRNCSVIVIDWTLQR